MAIRLSNDTLGGLPRGVAAPAYDRARLTPGIVHIGVGNFHRAHQAIYLDRLFGMGLDHDWAVLGAGARPTDRAMREDLSRQDWLSTVIELDASGLTARVCGSLKGFIEPEPSRIIAAMADPAIRIVSLTVTEGGYYVDAGTGGFDIGHPEIAADITQPDAPKTVFGMIVAALSARRETGLGGFTVMSCDNLPGNGHVARNAVIGLANEIDTGLAAWVADHTSFPNSMVDCIAPATGDRERALVRDRFGIDDARPVTCEPFRQWVLEDHFVTGRPALEKVGVQFVEDVAPYELMKLRILNAGHAAIAYPAALLGIEMVHEAMADPDVLGYLRRLQRDELIPSVPEIAGVDFRAYYQTVEQRFANAEVADTIARLCQDGSNRQPKFILPVARERAEAGESVEGLALEVALWCRYCAGIDRTTRHLALDDPRARVLREQARMAQDDPAAFLDMHDVFGSLSERLAFREAFATAVRKLGRNGVWETLKDYARTEQAACS